MSSVPQSEIGRVLYGLLPEVYRTRDAATGQLADYLDGFGEVLDDVHATLEQRLADCFADDPEGEEVEGAQTWLLPYLARLVNARLLSPHEDGRRREVADAIAWRQRKGTVGVVELVAEAVAARMEPGEEEGRRGVEIEVQEGWQRVAITPRVDVPLLPPDAYGVKGELPSEGDLSASRVALHPGLPAATIDLGRASRVLKADKADDPTAHRSTFGGLQDVAWHRYNVHGYPCFPGSYEDVSRRTVDFRNPSHSQGLYHHKRALLFAAPPTGFFSAERAGAVTLKEKTFTTSQTREGEVFGKVTVTAGSLQLRNCAIEDLSITSSGTAEKPSLDAVGCLFGKVTVEDAAQLEYCTVVEDFEASILNASDCIFAGELKVGSGCVRFSRIPRFQVKPPFSTFACTTDVPIFLDFDYCEDTEIVKGTGEYGEPGCGVLHPACPDSIRLGAEDGGEMGAFHEQHHVLEAEALREKVSSFLPVGIEPVLVLDPRLIHEPPEIDKG